MTTNQTKAKCKYCDGQGYVSERDCSGNVQRESTCPLCAGTGTQVFNPATE
ncbi:chaperone protein domain protein [[Synechococcus] sp. NIES-970]|uniref:hypothetical protein n=1 Tax=Picosynechococcus sp. NKBG15041c TaxID=1407650 RepID=UPI00042A8DEF|nr:hypothetical protein [Picosynechococcus sp. NKBG15041c]BAW97659.1 chaperone protein domain protein [[Synechococcus] sp. NIES-970]